MLLPLFVGLDRAPCKSHLLDFKTDPKPSKTTAPCVGIWETPFIASLQIYSLVLSAAKYKEGQFPKLDC